jgi:hypothetical protein
VTRAPGPCNTISPSAPRSRETPSRKDKTSDEDYAGPSAVLEEYGDGIKLLFAR